MRALQPLAPATPEQLSTAVRDRFRVTSEANTAHFDNPASVDGYRIEGIALGFDDDTTVTLYRHDVLHPTLPAIMNPRIPRLIHVQSPEGMTDPSYGDVAIWNPDLTEAMFAVNSDTRTSPESVKMLVESSVAARAPGRSVIIGLPVGAMAVNFLVTAVEYGKTLPADQVNPPVIGIPLVH